MMKGEQSTPPIDLSSILLEEKIDLSSLLLDEKIDLSSLLLDEKIDLSSILLEEKIDLSSIKSEEDRISLLPDCLLVEILSRLPDTKEAIRTGTLSKRWQHLWPQVPNLIIKELFLDDCPQFYSSIERIISQRGQSNLNKFKLFASYTDQTESQVNNCIRNAINRNVQQVDFHLFLHPSDFNYNGFVLPEFLFSCSSFIHLTLSWCIFKQAGVVSWKHLKSLSIKYGCLDEDLIENLLFGSPLLETLKLYNCYGFQRLDITNKSVKNLVLQGYYDAPRRYSIGIHGIHAPRIYSVEINAPCILSLTIQNHLLLEKLLLRNVSSVIKAELDYRVDLEGEEEDYEVNEEMLNGLLLSLGHVKEVKIGGYCLQALTGLKANGFIYPSNLKVLGEIDSR